MEQIPASVVAGMWVVKAFVVLTMALGIAYAMEIAAEWGSPRKVWMVQRNVGPYDLDDPDGDEETWRAVCAGEVWMDAPGWGGDIERARRTAPGVQWRLIEVKRYTGR